MDPRTEPSAAFGLCLSADSPTALAVTGVISKAAASTLVDDALAAILSSHPEYEASLGEISGAVTAQIGLISLAAERAQKQDTSPPTIRAKVSALASGDWMRF